MIRSDSGLATFRLQCTSFPNVYFDARQVSISPWNAGIIFFGPNRYFDYEFCWSFLCTTCTTANSSFLDPASSYGKPSSFSLPDSTLLAPSDDQTSETKETLFSEPSNKRTTLRMIAFLLRSLFFFYYILLQYISGCPSVAMIKSPCEFLGVYNY